MPGASASVAALNKVRDRYAEFLAQSNASEAALLERIGNDSARRAMFASATDFAEAAFEAITAIGSGSAFHRMLVV